VCAAGGGRREEEEKEKEPGIQNQKQEPHTKMWGKRRKRRNIKILQQRPLNSSDVAYHAPKSESDQVSG